MTRLRMRPAPIAILWCMAGLSLFAGERGSRGSDGEKPAMRPISVILVPQQQATLSAVVPSVVKDINKEMGQIFKENEELVLLDRTIYEANRDKAQAQQVSASAQVQSKEGLLVDGGASLAEVEAARMNLAVAKANLVLARKQLSSCTISAPYDGRVEKVLVNKHEVVQAGAELIRIVDDRVLRAQFLVGSAMLPRLKIGASVKIHVEEPEQDVIGKISHIGAVIDAASSSVKVFAEVDNRERALRGGARGTLRLVDVEAEHATGDE